jgi:hypothetical protein
MWQHFGWGGGRRNCFNFRKSNTQKSFSLIYCLVYIKNQFGISIQIVARAHPKATIIYQINEMNQMNE